MFHLSTVGFSRSLNTLLEVLALFQNDKHFAHVDADQVSLTHAGHTLFVTKYNGRLTVRMSGKMQDLFLAMLDEIDGAYFRPHGKLLEPWQIRPAHWDLLQFAFLLSTQPFYLFSSHQVLADAPGGQSLFQVLQGEAHARFGYGSAGPVVAGSGQNNNRHEVHLGYALAAGHPVPEGVIEDYTVLAEPFANDVRWALPLLRVPELRGAIPVAKLRMLLSVMGHAKQAITAENAALLAMVARLLPNEPTYVAADDMLLQHGLVSPRALPASYSIPVEIGSPASGFAEVLRRTLADDRRDAEIARLDNDRAKGNLSHREYQHRRQMALLDHGRQTYEYPNEVSAAIDRGEVGYLLQLLDHPDDWNRASKKAVREVFGLKLIGVKAAERRRAIFALGGLDGEQQAAFEREADARRDARLAAAAAERAREKAKQVRVKLDDGVIVDGARFVDQSVAAGFTQIECWKQGSSRRYSLMDPTRRVGYRLSAKDGTLEYARLVTQQPAA